ncbi:hypothetical protein ACFL2O_09730 [Thermodesulfobacteriota bacterium]
MKTRPSSSNEFRERRLCLSGCHLLLLLFIGLLLGVGCRPDCEPMRLNLSIGPPKGCVGEYYYFDVNSMLSADGAVPPFSYSLRDGDRSALNSIGLSFDLDTGIISGMPQTATDPGIEIQVTRTDSTPDNPLAPVATPVIEIHDFSVLSSYGVGCSGEFFSATIHLCGGEGRFHWEIESDAVADVSFVSRTTFQRSNSFSIENLPSFGEWEQITFRITVTDYADIRAPDDPDIVATGEFQIIISPMHDEDDSVLLPAVTDAGRVLPYATVGNDYSHRLELCINNARFQALVGEDCSGPVWGLYPGSPELPGLGVDSTGSISGRPTEAGLFPFEVQFGKVCTDSDGDEEWYRVGTAKMFMRVLEADQLTNYTGSPVVLDECQPCNIDINSEVLTGWIGEPPYWEDVDGGDIIPGVELTSDGRLSGQPSMPDDTYNPTVQVYDESLEGAEQELEFPLRIIVEPDDDEGLTIHRMRQWPLGDPDHPENILYLEFPPGEERELTVDFEIEEMVHRLAWEAATRQVILMREGDCASTTADLSPGETTATFSHTAFRGLVSEPGEYNFRIILRYLDDRQGIYVDLLKNRRTVDVRQAPE